MYKSNYINEDPQKFMPALGTIPEGHESEYAGQKNARDDGESSQRKKRGGKSRSSKKRVSKTRKSTKRYRRDRHRRTLRK